MFHLSKWYADLVTDQGTVLILYAARLQWGPIGIDYGSVLHTAGGTALRDEATWRRIAQPTIDGDVLTWYNDPLHVRGQWQRDAGPIDCTLTEGPSGAIRWTCHMPRARAVVRCGDDEFSGLGYAESLDLTVPPPRLPFHTLRWGRHLSAQHALVWIEWDADRRWIWLDGVEQGCSAAQDTSSRDYVRRRSGDPPESSEEAEGLRYGLLRLRASDEVRNRRIFGVHEHKQVSRSAIVRDGRPVDEGWAIHEVVTFSRTRGRGPRTEGRGSSREEA